MKELTASVIRELELAGWKRSRISHLEEHLTVRRTVPIYTIDMAKKFADGNADLLGCVASMLQRIDPTNADLSTLYAASLCISREMATPVMGPGKGKTAVWSVPLDDVPEQQLININGYKGARKTRLSMIYTLRQVYGAARRARLPEVYGQPALAALRAELDERGGSPRAIQRMMADLLRLGTLFERDDQLAELLRAERNAAKRNAEREPMARKVDFRANPLSPIDYAKHARDSAERAHTSTANRQTRHKLFLTAGVLALLSWMPIRVGDILEIVVGRDVVRTNKGWQLTLTANKGGADLSVPLLPDQLTPYLDDLILLGANPGFDSEVLDHLYRQRAAMQSPLFARICLQKAYSSNRVFQLIKAETGHGPHAARKSLPDYCAEIGLPIEDAMVLLGHKDRKVTKEHYEVHADMHRRTQTQDALSDVRRALAGQNGQFRMPGGRLADIDRINGRLLRRNDVSPPTS